MTFCAPELKAEYLTECLLEVINERWWLDMTESDHPYAHKAFIREGRKYLKIMMCDVTSKHEDYNPRNGGRVFMFVDKNTGDIYKPASLNAPAKGVRFNIDFLVDHPEVVDPYGSFLYIR